MLDDLKDAGSALRAYRECGYARISSLFSEAEIAAYRAEAARISAIDGLFGDADRGMIRTGGPRADRVDPVIDVSPMFAALAHDSRLLQLAEQALDAEPQLLKDKLILKPSGSGGYGVHQDIAYWHELKIDGRNAMTIALCLDPCTQASGAIEFAPGHHHVLLTKPGIVADPDENQFSAFEILTAEPGDLLLFSALAPHRSGTNCSSEQRRILFLTYVNDRRDDMYRYYQKIRQNF